MINLFTKLKSEGLLKKNGRLIDLGSGRGAVSLPFFKEGYRVTLVDIDSKALEEARRAFAEVRPNDFEIQNSRLETSDFDTRGYDGVILSSVLPFLKDKGIIADLARRSYESLNQGGFLFMSLFGQKDEWAQHRADTMSFFTKEEALDLLGVEPYFLSEDYGRGVTRAGASKIWHTFSILYLK